MASFSHWSNPVMGGSGRPAGARAAARSSSTTSSTAGTAGRSSKDGAEGLCPVFNATNIPVEVHESQAPVRVRRFEFIPDSAGAGRFRGGCGVRKDVELLASRATVSLSGDPASTPPARPRGRAAGDPGRDRC